jgi:cysteine desulfurase
MESTFGNPSSIHSFGREARVLIENARKTVAGLLGISPAELFFTSGGTEANNMALQCGVRGLGIKQVITSPIEHHAVLHTLEVLEKAGAISIHFVNLTDKGHVDLDHLEKLLKSNGKSLVSLMHANNEIGNITSLKKVGELCGQYDAVFHSDTVQTMAHYRHDLSKLNVHFANCAPHKFHGPKGVGFLYINSKVKIQPLLYGGAQERNMRGGTENVYGIAGLAKAMEIAYSDMDGDHQYIQGLKTYMITRLRDAVPGVQFNGDAEGKSLYTVLNVSFPPSDISEMLLFKLDIEGIAVSGGSACASGSNAGSHVLKALGVDPNRPAVRFSFSKYNTKEEIDFCIEKLKSLFIAKTYRG